MHYVTTGLLAGALLVATAPVAPAQQLSSPYRTSWAADAPITGGLMLAAGTGYYLMQHKQGLSPQGQAALDKQNIPSFDRWAAGKYSAQAQQTSNFIVYPSLVLAPALLALDGSVRNRYGQVLGLYVQSVALTDAIFTLSAGTVYRYRPLLYDSDAPAEQRGGRIATESFFAGHTAHTATATFFVAKVFHDFHPNSSAEPWVWGAAAAIPAIMACTRVEAGKHFLSDNVVGYVIGAASGILVPQLHKVQRRGRTQPAVWGTTAGAATGILLPQLTSQRHGLSFLLLQGQNVHGYAYGGVQVVKQL